MNSVTNDAYNLPPSPPSDSPVSLDVENEIALKENTRKRKSTHAIRMDDEEESQTPEKKPGKSVPKYQKNPEDYTGAEKRSIIQAINMHKHHQVRDLAFKTNPYLKQKIDEQKKIICDQQEKNDQHLKTISEKEKTIEQLKETIRQSRKTIEENINTICEDKKTIEQQAKTIREMKMKEETLQSQLKTERENKTTACADFDAGSYAIQDDVYPDMRIYPELEFDLSRLGET